MWESPSWIGTLMTAKVKERTDAERRSLDALIAANELSVRNANAYYDRVSRESIAEQDRENAKKIAEERIQSDKDIATERNKTSRDVALMQMVGNVAPKVLPIVLGAKVLNKDSNDHDSTLNTNSGTGVAISEPVVSSREEAKRKADDLFPELDRTFQQKSYSPMGSRPVKFGLGAVVTAGLAAAVTALTSIPIL